MYTLNQLSNEGHCYARRDQLTQEAVKLFEIDNAKLSYSLDHMLKEQDLITESQAKEVIYLPPLYYSEVGVSKRIKQIIATPGKESLANLAINPQIEYDATQLEAIRTAATTKVMILTGGPGTGKTTTTKGIIELFQQNNFKVLLAAPTGRAAKRLNETTGLEAKTIHRLLEFKPPQGYQKNEDNLLDGDVLIVDEASMLDIVLTYNLLKAMPPEMRLIFIGDIDQLPSVGPGNVLRDLINSSVIPTIKLTKIFRQAQGSTIICNAHRINQGEYPQLKNGSNSDFFLWNKMRIA